MSSIERLIRSRPRCCAAALAAALLLLAAAPGLAQDGSKGENFSAGKSPAQLFASDCTGSGCHKSPQGLGRKSIGIGGLSGFLREHYTNSRESANALANYLQRLPTGPEPREARKPRDGKPETPSSASASSGPAAAPLTPAPARWFEGITGDRSGDRASRQNATGSRDNRESATGSRPSRTPAKPDADTKPDDETATAARQTPAAAKPEPDAKPDAKLEAKPDEEPAAATRASARSQRGRPAQGATAAATPPPAPSAAAAEPEPAPPPPPPAAKQFDIFD